MREHQALIRRQYGYRDFAWPWTFRLNRLLFTRSWLNNERLGLLFDLATAKQNTVAWRNHTDPSDIGNS
ncbi:transposase [Erwinia tracheiphila PSU-1]|nr:transposase [Erwinia tracheiphila PSU-1]